MPTAWSKIKNQETGQVYYYNSETNETSWDKPVALAWKEGVTADGRSYFYNKVSKISTFDRPAEMPDAKPSGSPRQLRSPIQRPWMAAAAAARLSAYRRASSKESLQAMDTPEPLTGDAETTDATSGHARKESLELPLPKPLRTLLSGDMPQGNKELGEEPFPSSPDVHSSPQSESLKDRESTSTKAAAAASAARRNTKVRRGGKGRKLRSSWMVKSGQNPKMKKQDADLERLRQRKGRTVALRDLTTMDRKTQETFSVFFTGEAEQDKKDVNQLVNILKAVKALPPNAADLTKYLDRLIKDWIIEAVRATGKEISDADVDAMCNSIQDVFKSEPVKVTMKKIFAREKAHPSKLVKVRRKVKMHGKSKPKAKKKKMRRKKIKVLVAPPPKEVKTTKLVRPDYKALAGICNVKFNNAKTKGPKLVDCFLGMAAKDLKSGTMMIGLRGAELHCMEQANPGNPTIFDLRLASKFVVKATKGRNAINVFIEGMSTQNYITLSFGTNAEMKEWVTALRLNMALAKENTPLVMAGYVKKAPTSGAPASRAAFKTRYMTLCGNLLKYYEDGTMNVLKGMVWLDKDCSVSRVSATDIEVRLGSNQGGKKLRFAAKTEAEAQKWFDSISSQLDGILKNFHFDAHSEIDVAAVSVDQSALIEVEKETDEWETDTDAEDSEDDLDAQYQEIEEWVLKELDPDDEEGKMLADIQTDADGFMPRFKNEAQRLHYEQLYVQFMLERGRKMLDLIFMTPAGETVLTGEAIADAKRAGVYSRGFVPTAEQFAIAKNRVMGMLEGAIRDYFKKKFRATYPVMEE